MSENKQNICIEPFSYVEIHADGNVSLCCPGYTNNFFIGNIFQTNSFEKIWNSEKAIDFRNSILDGSYKYCNRSFCWYNQNTRKIDIEIQNPIIDIYPTKVNFCHDKQCNVRCITCRDEHIKNEKEHEEYLNSLIEPFFIPMLKNTRVVSLNGGGEVFASNHMKLLVKTITKKYPNIIFNIQSNGILFNKNNCDELGITDKIVSVKISIHSATKKTYDKIVIGGNFEKVIENVQWLSSLIGKTKLSRVILEFVITSINYKEMPMFVKLAKQFNVIASFSTYRPWNSKLAEEYNNVAIFEPSHPEHKKFIKILENPIFDTPFCIMQNSLKELREQKKKNKFSFIRKIINQAKM